MENAISFLGEIFSYFTIVLNNKIKIKFITSNKSVSVKKSSPSMVKLMVLSLVYQTLNVSRK